MKKGADTRWLASDLASLPELDRESLVKWWQNLYGKTPPAGISQVLLRYSIAYRLQENALGGLKPSTRKLLKQIAEDSTKTIKPTLSIKAGTRLLREWHGVTHEVIVAEEKVLYSGKEYRSLSEVARVITGVRWSGPLFFGLKKG